MDTATPIQLVDQLQDHLDAANNFRTRHQAMALGGSAMDRAGLEMLGAEYELSVGNEAQLLDLVKGVAVSSVKRTNGVFEQLAAWFDRSGVKELQLLKRQVDQLVSANAQPTTRTIADRKLADDLQIDGVLVPEHGHLIQELIRGGHVVTDTYAPLTLDFLGHVFDVVERSKFIRSYSEDDLVALLDEVLAQLASKQDPILQAAGMVDSMIGVGSRRLFAHYPPPSTHPFGNRLQSADAKKVIEHWKARDTELVSAAQVKRPQGTARVGVVPVLTLEEIQGLIDALAGLIDQIDRAKKIFKDVRKQERALSCVSFFNSIEEITEYTLDPAKHQGESTVVVSNLDALDRQKLELIDTYLRDSALSASQVVIRMTQQFLAVRQVYVRYIHASLKYYR